VPLYVRAHLYAALPFPGYFASRLTTACQHFANYADCNKKCKTMYGRERGRGEGRRRGASWKLDFCFERPFCWQRFF